MTVKIISNAEMEFIGNCEKDVIDSVNKPVNTR